MNKIPTVVARDPEDRARVLPDQVTPGCDRTRPEPEQESHRHQWVRFTGIDEMVCDTCGAEG